MVVFNKEQRMKTLAVCVGLLTAFFITACGMTETVPIPGSKLRGTWKSNDPTDYSGTVTITISSNSINNRITINGYSKAQTPPPIFGGDDSTRPFNDFTKGYALKCRWDLEEDKLEGKLFITDRGKEQEGIPFVYYEGDLWQINSFEKRRDKFICFTFGGREEILENTENFQIQEPPPVNTP
jgi:hypothetical protein